MNINQGLKEKNRLAGKIKVLDQKIHGNARWIKGNTPSYELEALLREREATVIALNVTKTKISRATQPIVHKIFEMGEKKSLLTILKGLDVSRGIENDRYRASVTVTEYESAMSETIKDKLVDDLTKEIAALQDELDQYNAVTGID